MSIMEPHTEKLKYIFDNAKVGIAICNAQDNTLEMVNPAFAHIHGYEPHELIGVSPGEVFAPECMLRLSEYESAPSCAINDVAFETTHIRKDGSQVAVSVHITVIKDEHGTVKQRIANITDISVRKEAESKLKMTSERFNQIYHNSPDVIYLIEVTPEGRFIHLDINPAYVRASGMAREAIVGRYVDEIEHEPFRNILLDKYNSCLKAGEKTDYINDYPLPSGIQTFHSILTPLFDENGRIHQIIGITRDITEQKNQKQQLTIKEREFRSLAENTPDNIARWDTEGRYLYINPVHERTLGKSATEIVGTFIPDSHEAVKAAITQVATTGEKMMVRQSAPNEKGEIEFHDVNIVAEKDPSGKIISVLGIGRDITETKKIAMDLEKNEKILQEAQRIAHVGSWDVDIINDVLTWSDETYRIWEIDKESFEATFAAFLETVHPEDRELVTKTYNDSIINHSFYDVEHRLLFPDGRVKYIHERGEPYYDKEGTPIRFIGTSLEITERKRSERELEKTQAQLSAIISTIPDLIWVKNEEGAYMICNPALERFLGMQKSEIIGKTDYDYMDAEVANYCKQSDLDAIAADTVTISYETFSYPDSGTEGILEIRKIPVSMPNGESVGILGIGRDITERKHSEDHLQRTKAKLSAVISTIPDLIWVKDVAGVYMMCNPSFENFFGAECGEIIGKTDYDFIAREQADFFRQKDAEALAAGKMCINEEEIVFAHNGQHALLETRKIPVYNGEEFMGVLGIGRDITERKKMESEIAKQKDFQNTLLLSIAEAGLGVHVIEEGRYIYTNHMENAKRYGYDETFCDIKPNFIETIHPDDRAKALDMYTRRLRGEDVPTTYELGVVQKDGTRREHSVSVIVIPNTDPIQTIVITQDISERKLIEKKVEFMAHHDALTGLPNRILAKDRTEQIIAHAKRTGSKVALLFIDLDGFKAINDSMGHSMGDAVLKIIATRLMEGVRACDTISRQGGDEFLLILSDIEELHDIVTIAEKLIQEFDQPFYIGEQALSTSASIGIAIYPENGESFEALLQSADTAMYKAKESGKNAYCFYTQQMNHNLIGQFKLQNDLKNALKHNEFILHYQPQIDLAKNRIIGAEALIRWQHPQMGMVPPMSFISLAESSGIIVQIGQWVIEEACRQAAQWQNEGKEITVAVNISAVQFKRGNLEAIVKNALESSGLNPKLLELELTESILINDVENILKTVQILKGLGIQLSIDDFGTGYSSLAYLKRFAVDKLKIDQSFVRDILKDQEDAAIVRTIIQMAKSLNLKTIAEGVEDGQVLAVIDSYGCDEVQGYHFAKPMEANIFERYYEGF